MPGAFAKFRAWRSVILEDTWLVHYVGFDNFIQNLIIFFYSSGGCPRGVMVKVMDCGIVVSEFVFQLRSLSGKYPWERYEPPYPPSYGLNSTSTVILGEWLWH